MAKVQPLGFRFDVDAVIIDGKAHQTDCPLIPRPLPADAAWLSAGDVYHSHRCPQECKCSPPFETLLSYQLETAAR